jgi:hypothetical protein
MKLNGDEHIKTSNYFMASGLESFKNNTSNYKTKFSKNVNDLIL